MRPNAVVETSDGREKGQRPPIRARAARDDLHKTVAGRACTGRRARQACQEEGCPDVELVITLRRPRPQPKLMFKIYKAAADLTHEQLEKGLKLAKAWEESKPAAEV